MNYDIIICSNDYNHQRNTERKAKLEHNNKQYVVQYGNTKKPDFYWRVSGWKTVICTR